MAIIFVLCTRSSESEGATMQIGMANDVELSLYILSDIEQCSGTLSFFSSFLLLSGYRMSTTK